jgi:hypothetical protein
MVPSLLLVQIALIIIAARSGYQAMNLLKKTNKNWFDILYYLSIVIVVLSFLF